VEDNSAPDLEGGRPESVSGDGVNGIYYLENSWPFYERDSESGRMVVSTADAMTVIRADGSGMTEADIYFRGTSFKLSPTQVTNRAISSQQALDWVIQSAPENAQWLYKVGIHEMGHALG